MFAAEVLHSGASFPYLILGHHQCNPEAVWISKSLCVVMCGVGGVMCGVGGVMCGVGGVMCGVGGMMCGVGGSDHERVTTSTCPPPPSSTYHSRQTKHRLF